MGSDNITVIVTMQSLLMGKGLKGGNICSLNLQQSLILWKEQLKEHLTLLRVSYMTYMEELLSVLLQQLKHYNPGGKLARIHC